MIRSFIDFLVNRHIERFEDALRTDIGKYLSTERSQNTKNLHLFILKNFYTDYLGKEEIVKHFHQKSVKKAITLSELLTVEEIMKLAIEADKRRGLEQNNHPKIVRKLRKN